MIHLISLQNWAKHHGKTFTFTEGLNLIRGENEAGKSLILEAIDYALHGTVALRLPMSMYPAGLFVCLITTIGGSRYRIERSPKKTELYNDETNEVVAKGTRPVDAEIRKLLGYNRNVFLMANYSCQDQISYLSSMTPAERKRTIDNVVGLTAVEQVIKQHKDELTILNRERKSIVVREVAKPEEPEVAAIENLDELLQKETDTVNQLAVEIQAQLTLKNNLESLRQHKPEFMPEPDLSGLLPEWDQKKITQYYTTRQHLEKRISQLQARLDGQVQPQRLSAPDLSGLIEGLTNEKIAAHDTDLKSVRAFIHVNQKLCAQHQEQINQGTYTPEQIAECEKAEELYSDWVHAQNLKAKGSVICNHCGGEVHLANHTLADYQHVVNLDAVPEPEVSSRKMRQVASNYNAAVEELASQQSTLNSFVQREKELVDNWYTAEQLENHRLTEIMQDKYLECEHEYQAWKKRVDDLDDDLKYVKAELAQLTKEAPTDEMLEQNLKAREAEKNYQQYVARLADWENQYNALGEFKGQEFIDELRICEMTSKDKINFYWTTRDLWSKYNTELSNYNKWFAEYTANQEAVDHEQRIVDSLQDYKGRIKSSILPSVNAVATTWIKRMSQGHHFKVELTDSMEVLVNNEPIEALSISGRALGHLALRMALGQVLTTRVYPVFIADEVDASMRPNRAQDVLNALTDMLNGPVKQIIMISHRELDHEATVIEV